MMFVSLSWSLYGLLSQLVHVVDCRALVITVTQAVSGGWIFDEIQWQLARWHSLISKLKSSHSHPDLMRVTEQRVCC